MSLQMPGQLGLKGAHSCSTFIVTQFAKQISCLSKMRGGRSKITQFLGYKALVVERLCEACVVTKFAIQSN